jgi:protoheme IX farnesyltransferase
MSPAIARLGRVLLDLLVFTGYAAIAVHREHATDWAYIWPCLLALFTMGGAANTLNQLFELRKDAVMERTKARRPLPAGRVTPAQAWVFAAIQLCFAEAVWVVVYGSWLAAALGLLTVVYYSFFYTLWLKPRHYLNIVIGGVPGGSIDLAPLAMFAVIFLWTPPHVWALAIRLKDDYARAGIPMLPVVKGVDETTRQIFWYTVVLVVATLAVPVLVPAFSSSPLYTVLALVLGAVFLVWTAVLWKCRPVMPTMPLFRFSIIYIGALFIGMVVDAMTSGGAKP